ncbi:hypothetical protein FQZ97_1047380 [compost metagenome]
MPLKLMLSMPTPVTGSSITAPQTQTKKRRNTSSHSFSLAGASSATTAAGRRIIHAKNMPPTQTRAASTCRA